MTQPQLLPIGHDLGELSWPLWASTSPFIREEFAMEDEDSSAWGPTTRFKSQLGLSPSCVTLDKSFSLSQSQIKSSGWG